MILNGCLHLCVLDGGANSYRITGQGTVITTLWVSHNPAVLAAEIQLSELCFFSTWHAELRPNHLNDRGNTV